MRKVLPMLVLILTSIAAYLWFEPDDSNSMLRTDQELMPDYVATDVTRTLFNAEGYRADSVAAAQLEHFEQLGFTQFDQPVYTLFNAEHKPSWQASSRSAIWFPQDRVILEQDVVIESLLQSELVRRIETSTLEMLFPDNRLQNNQPVYIQGDGFFIEGIGLRADLTEKTLQLIQHNKTVYRNEG
ncbi:LPS export ABC transporter periplasmic protein LptC [Rheinheimera maricola]|uniref:Lipopolysaccharide export system protein LptC n=1 Tax=Rheinheimera maricola TaxID=2793282 RepID=A0ABS7X9H9_9GAMM|nr:LPS export ABC transporter periplasmic protein LptC [Rheinheimera maricola]MBZ9612214.1 LPS export ABC transporter periplasmic protein LptC [Rheinheimera maricola]